MTCSRNKVVASVLASAVLAACGSGPVERELPVRAIRWMEVLEPGAAQERHISGVIRAVEDTRLAFEVAGTVARVEADLGDDVAKDQVLAELDPQPFELRVRDAEAAVASARATRQEAAQNFERVQLLFEAASVSKAEFDRARARRDTAVSQLRAANAHLSLAQRQRRKAVLRAPFAGSISVKSVDAFEEVAAGQVLFEMDSLDEGLEVDVRVPAALISHLETGVAVAVTTPTLPERELAGEIAHVGTRAGAGNAFPVKVALRDRLPELRPGMTAEVAFQFREPAPDVAASPPAYMLPLTAVLSGPDNRHFVFVFDPEASVVHKRPIEIRNVHGNTYEIGSGLESGEIVATAGVSFLSDAQQVTLLEARSD